MYVYIYTYIIYVCMDIVANEDSPCSETLCLHPAFWSTIRSSCFKFVT